MTGSNLWEKSSLAWIKSLGENGDFGRAHVLDTPMIERVKALAPANALDVGCGEGRFCRFMQKLGIKTTGVDPTQSLISEARRRDSLGDYRLETAENMVIEPHSFDLVVSYLSFIDISDIASAIAKMVHALRPGGALLVANLNSFNTAAMPDGWHFDNQARARFSIDYYLEERAIPVA
ncbi:MAG: class I SAM-dependent methyltransferase [Sphingorhabdus sp.]